jgi:hypothetical protein
MNKLSLLMLVACLLAKSMMADNEAMHADKECDQVLDSKALWAAHLGGEKELTDYFERFYPCALANQEKAEALLAEQLHPFMAACKRMPRILKLMDKRGYRFSTEFVEKLLPQEPERNALEADATASASISEQHEQNEANLQIQAKEQMGDPRSMSTNKLEECSNKPRILECQFTKISKEFSEKIARATAKHIVLNEDTTVSINDSCELNELHDARSIIIAKYNQLIESSIVYRNCEGWSIIDGATHPRLYELCKLYNDMARLLQES